MRVLTINPKYSLPVILAPFLILLFLDSQCASAKFCTKLQSQIRRNTSTILVTCIQKFQETCSFLDIFSYCTHYRIARCEKKLNFTYQWYYAVQECCPGYYKVSNHSCMAPKEAAELPIHLQTEETRVIAQKHMGPAPVKLSVGAYAGIAAAGVLLLCIIGLVIVVIHRQRKKKKHTEQAIEMEHVSLQPESTEMVQQNGLNPTESVLAEQKVGLNVTESEQSNQHV